jgi:hypothetical protein
MLGNRQLSFSRRMAQLFPARAEAINHSIERERTESGISASWTSAHCTCMDMTMSFSVPEHRRINLGPFLRARTVQVGTEALSRFITLFRHNSYL